VITAADAWERYAANVLPRRGTNAAGATTWLNWTQYPDHGPDESVLGDLRGRTVLELGSGTGSNLAHVATTAAYCVGVDLAPSRTIAARATWGDRPNLKFVTADALNYLTARSMRFDAVYSIFGAVWFTDPRILLPLVRNRMAPGGVFAFSQLPATENPPASPDRAITKWNYSLDQWARLLTVEGFDSVTTEVILAPAAHQPGTLLVRARAC